MRIQIIALTACIKSLGITSACFHMVMVKKWLCKDFPSYSPKLKMAKGTERKVKRKRKKGN
jgi:hypothetical protein